LLNHSCDPNAVVGFDQGTIFVKALRPIKDGEQISISYIDNTNPFAVRQKELLDRYFFNCTCSKCAKGTATREDQFLTSNPDPSIVAMAEQKAADVPAPGKGHAMPPTGVAINLAAAMETLRETGIWPITRQPFVQLRDDLIISLLDGSQFWSAFVQLAIRYLRIDPVVFPDTWHPLRNVHAWTFVKLAIYLFEVPDASNPDTEALRRSGVNLGWIIYSVLRKLNESSDYDLPTASRNYKETYDQVRKEFKDNGLDPDNMEAEIRAEWANLEKIVDDSENGRPPFS
jgi:SET and MYND domain-containing protein